MNRQRHVMKIVHKIIERKIHPSLSNDRVCDNIIVEIPICECFTLEREERINHSIRLGVTPLITN